MCKSYSPNLLAVGCWNIEGLYKKVNGVKLCKMDDETFQTTKKSLIFYAYKKHILLRKILLGNVKSFI